ncbi:MULTISPECIES: TIGR02587 family membrane protein [unclassified Modestobacter]|uniref:TIGR02587 family membrane protein n=1 Tax=unclassified Modestobacter TaxID=2643866 RepID=UPI0022AAFACB|nr:MULTISPECIES: TIGR02587 family membrane protein [unclassified Modestobacter]MCZ2824476.1 TIGR02587 family membrane protein [Modestobacter sp. VKM Ac-2981]MCZ2853996.1 TIGR02587 family membrane protein [Modestobacter sp. VKM Ac-2982]
MPPQTETRRLAQGFGRAVGGALLFALPVLMTMEVWRLSLSIDRHRLLVLTVGTVLLVVGLARRLGIAGGGWRAASVDAGVAFLAAAVAAAVVLTTLGVLDWLRDWRDATSILGLALLPAAVGASYARAQLGEGGSSPARSGYGHEVFLMAAGAVVFAASLAPTEEIVLLAATMTPWHTLALVGTTLALMHAFVYQVGFGGQEHDDGPIRAFVGFTLVGYAVALCLSAYLLWALGRFDDTGLVMVVTETVVLALPAGLGAAVARLIL